MSRIGIAAATVARETPEGLQLIDGHLRAELDPDVELPVLVVDLDEAEAEEFLASADPLSAMALPDMSALQSLLDDMPRVPPIDFEALYGDQAEALVDQENTPADDTELEPPDDPITKPGDLWLMGDHRLMCGDCTDAKQVKEVPQWGHPRSTLD